MSGRRQLVITPLESTHPEIGRALWTLADARARTNALLEALSDPMVIDWKPEWALHSVGTLLYHIALVEADWLYVEVQGNPYDQPYPGALGELFPYKMRTDNALTVVNGISLEAHRARLATMRAMLLDFFRTLSIEDFRKTRAMPEAGVSPEWVLHHLSQHEAEHRSEISALWTAYKQQTGA